MSKSRKLNVKYVINGKPDMKQAAQALTNLYDNQDEYLKGKDKEAV